MKLSWMWHIVPTALLLAFVVVRNVIAEDADDDENARLRDEVFQMSATSQYLGLGDDDIVQTDIDTFFQNILWKQKEAILFLDAPWSIDSKRGWPIVKEIYGNITTFASTSTSDNDTIPMYAYIYKGWNPNHTAFKEWWAGHVYSIDDFPAFAFTKYRAILLIIKEGQIEKIWVNAVIGEGGGFCIHKVIMDVLGRPVSVDDMTPTEANYYNRVCVNALHHPLRTEMSNILMSGSPCGWINGGDTYPDACDAVRSEKL